MISLSFLVATENKYALMQSLLDRQTALSVAINSFIEDRGTMPGSMAVLQNSNYLPLAYDGTNPFDKDALTFSIANNQIRIDTNLETTKISDDKSLYYANTIKDRGVLDRRSAQEGGKLISYYALSVKAALNLNLPSYLSYATLRGDTDPSVYSSVTSGALWFSSTYEDMYQVKLFDGSSWGNLEKGNKNFDSLTGDFVNLPTLQISKSAWQTSQVNVTQQTKPILCLNGGTFNVYKLRCEAYTSNACSTDTTFNTSTKLCDKGANSACTWYDPNGVYNGSTCERIVETNSYLHLTADPAKLGCQDIIRIVAVSSHTFVIGDETDDWSEKAVTGLNQNLIYINNIPYTVTYSYHLYNDSSYNSYFYTTFKNNSTGQVYTYGANYPIEIAPGFTYGTINVSGETYYTTNSYAHTALDYYVSANEVYVQITPHPYRASYCQLTEKISLASKSEKEYYTPKCDPGYTPVGGRCAVTPTCTGKTMPVSPFYATPYNGNNGVCYSDAALLCAQSGISWDGIYTCFNTNFTCNDTTYNLRSDLGICEKFGYSCTTGKRYGLPESPTNNDATDLYNRITNKDDKLTAIVSTITNSDYNTNDNGGAICAAVGYSTLSQPVYSPDYNIGGEIKSGF
jgi:hypothetical protein